MIDFIVTVLFETWPWLVFFGAVAVTVALAVHRRRMSSGSRRGIWITLAVCILLLIVQHLVVTDREALERVIRVMARAVDEGDVGALAEHVAENMQWRSDGREEFLRDVTSRLTATQINEARISQVTATVDGDTADVTFLAFCDIKDGQIDQPNVPSFWKLHFVKRAGQWLMDQILEAEIRPGALPTANPIDLMPMIR